MKKKSTSKKVNSSNFGCHIYRIKRFNDDLKEIDLTVENFVEFWIYFRKTKGWAKSPYRLGVDLIQYCHKEHNGSYDTLIGRELRKKLHKDNFNIHDAHTAALMLHAEGYLS